MIIALEKCSHGPVLISLIISFHLFLTALQENRELNSENKKTQISLINTLFIPLISLLCRFQDYYQCSVEGPSLK